MTTETTDVRPTCYSCRHFIWQPGERPHCPDGHAMRTIAACAKAGGRGVHIVQVWHDLMQEPVCQPA